MLSGENRSPGKRLAQSSSVGVHSHNYQLTQKVLSKMRKPDEGKLQNHTVSSTLKKATPSLNTSVVHDKTPQDKKDKRNQEPSSTSTRMKSPLRNIRENHTVEPSSKGKNSGRGGGADRRSTMDKKRIGSTDAMADKLASKKRENTKTQIGFFSPKASIARCNEQDVMQSKPRPNQRTDLNRKVPSASSKTFGQRVPPAPGRVSTSSIFRTAHTPKTRPQSSKDFSQKSVSPVNMTPKGGNRMINDFNWISDPNTHVIYKTHGEESSIDQKSSKSIRNNPSATKPPLNTGGGVKSSSKGRIHKSQTIGASKTPKESISLENALIIHVPTKTCENSVGEIPADFDPLALLDKILTESKRDSYFGSSSYTKHQPEIKPLVCNLEYQKTLTESEAIEEKEIESDRESIGENTKEGGTTCVSIPKEGEFSEIKNQEEISPPLKPKMSQEFKLENKKLLPFPDTPDVSRPIGQVHKQAEERTVQKMQKKPIPNPDPPVESVYVSKAGQGATVKLPQTTVELSSAAEDDEDDEDEEEEDEDPEESPKQPQPAKAKPSSSPPKPKLKSSSSSSSDLEQQPEEKAEAEFNSSSGSSSKEQPTKKVPRSQAANQETIRIDIAGDTPLQEKRSNKEYHAWLDSAVDEFIDVRAKPPASKYDLVQNEQLLLQSKKSPTASLIFSLRSLATMNKPLQEDMLDETTIELMNPKSEIVETKVWTRKGVEEVFKRLSEKYEIIIFSNFDKQVTNKLLPLLDRSLALVSHLLYAPPFSFVSLPPRLPPHPILVFDTSVLFLPSSQPHHSFLLLPPVHLEDSDATMKRVSDYIVFKQHLKHSLVSSLLAASSQSSNADLRNLLKLKYPTQSHIFKLSV